MVVVFRVEDIYGNGPYRFGMTELCIAHRNAAHPPPDLDPSPTDGNGWTTRAYNTADPTSAVVSFDVEKYRVLDIDPDEVCALPNVDRLAEWFSGFGEFLEDKGYSVIEYEVPRDYVRHGKHQTVFNKNAALKIRQHSPRQLIGA